MDFILNELKAHHRIRDPIYGFIRLTDSELEIVDSPLFQRLRRVHQLALTKYVYPSAEHSRFVHSLGVMNAATAMFAAVVNNEASGYDYSGEEKIRLCKLLRFAALLHDIGHLPFSHAAEKTWLKNFGHEAISCHIISNYDPIKEALAKVDVVPSTVASLLTDQYQPHHRLIHEIVSGQLDADRADYLLRDSYYCGVRYGEYDFDRYTGMFAASEEDKTFRLSIDEKDIHVAEAFLIARYHYNMQVPFHRTRSGFDIALRLFLKERQEENQWFEVNEDESLVDMDFLKFESLDDYAMFNEFKVSAAKGNFWANCLLRLNHLKLVMDETYNLDSGREEFKAYVGCLEGAGFVKEHDFFTLDKKVAILKDVERFADEASDQANEAGSKSDQNTILVRKRSVSHASHPTVDIREISWIFKHFAENPPFIYRVYVKPDRFGEACEVLKMCRGGDHGLG